MIPLGAQLERNNALDDARSVINDYGDDIAVYRREETDIERDAYNSIIRRVPVEPILMKAYPIQFNPTENQLFKAGLRERVDVIIYTAMKDWIEHDLTDPYFQIDESRFTVELQGRTYLIKDKNYLNQFADSFLNITLGLVIR